jgi:cytochrome c-type protein NapB
MKKVILVVLAFYMTVITVYGKVELDSCKGCHGQNFEKKALGKSYIVSEMSQEDVTNALIGYKDKTYGRSMKGIMVGQIKDYTNKELSETGIGKSIAFAGKDIPTYDDLLNQIKELKEQNQELTKQNQLLKKNKKYSLKDK